MSKPASYGSNLMRAKDDLRAAYQARKDHADDCAKWDYEGSNGCEECDRRESDVIAARHRVHRWQNDCDRLAPD